MSERLAALAALLLVALAEPAGAGEARDMLGRLVVAPDRPSRIVSLAPSMTEIVYALGAADRLVGVTEFCDYPAAARTKPKVGGIYTPSFEAILALEPDLVLATSEGNQAEHIHALDRLRLPVYVVRPLDFTTVLESITRVGGLIGREVEAGRLVARMQGEADAIARSLRDTRRPRVLYVLWGNPLISAGRDTLITDLVRRAGGDSITGTEVTPYPRFSMEEVVVRRPEWIIVAQHDDRSVDDRLRAWEQLTLIPAVRDGRIRAVDGDLVHRPGPRIIDGLRAIAHILHPEAIP